MLARLVTPKLNIKIEEKTLFKKVEVSHDYLGFYTEYVNNFDTVIRIYKEEGRTYRIAWGIKNRKAQGIDSVYSEKGLMEYLRKY